MSETEKYDPDAIWEHPMMKPLLEACGYSPGEKPRPILAPEIPRPIDTPLDFGAAEIARLTAINEQLEKELEIERLRVKALEDTLQDML